MVNLSSIRSGELSMLSIIYAGKVLPQIIPLGLFLAAMTVVLRFEMKASMNVGCE